MRIRDLNIKNMARITVEEALEKVSTRYELIILAAKRARQLATGGRRPTLEWEDDKPTVMALREIEAGTVTTDNINELKVDIADLEQKLIESQAQRNRIIVTDGVFSMDGYIAQLDKICDLADKYDALVMVDECHSTGFIGKTGRGTHEYHNVMGRVDIITGTLGKALGGAMGGFTSGRKEIIDMLRQRSRPYLFSNSLAPSIVGSAIQVLDILLNTTELRDKLESNTSYFRSKMTEAGFDIKDGVHPIVPVMLYDAKTSQIMADKLLEEGIYVIGFFYPVVPKEQARIRVQISAAHTKQHLDKAISAFTKVGKEMKIIK